MVWIRDKKSEILLCLQNCVFLTHFPLGKKTLCLYKLSSYQLASVTEAILLWQKLFVCDRIFFCVRNFFLWQKCVSLKETWTETCFYDGNWFSEGIFSLTDIFSDTSLFLGQFFSSFCAVIFFLLKMCAGKWSTKTLNMIINWVKLDKKLKFPACTYKSQNFAQSQLNFAPSHDSEMVTFINSEYVLVFYFPFPLLFIHQWGNVSTILGPKQGYLNILE